MEHPGLSFLMNLTGNGGNPGAAEAPAQAFDGSEPNAVNAFFTIHAGLAKGDASGGAGSMREIMNGDGGGFFGHFELAGNGFDIDRPEEIIATREIDGAVEIASAETILFNRGFNRRMRGDIVSGAGIEQIDRRDVPNNSESGRGLRRPEISVGVRVVAADAPAIAKKAETKPTVSENRALSAFAENRNDNGFFKNRASGERFTIASKIFAPIPAASHDQLGSVKDQIGPKLQIGQTPALNIGQEPALNIKQENALSTEQGPALNIEHEPVLNVDQMQALNTQQKPAHNQKPAPNQSKPFDIAAITELRQISPRSVAEPGNEAMVRESAQEGAASPRNPNAAIAAAPNAAAAVLAQTGEVKRDVVLVDTKMLLNVESVDPASDEAIFIEARGVSGGDAGRMTPTTTPSALMANSAFGAAPMTAERVAAEESVNAPTIDLGAISTANSLSERAPIQFFPPNTAVPAGAAWAQVISAISERNGEAKLELRLNPPELGRVTIAFEGDGAELVRAIVSADSQQTLDLMRRNIDILQRELVRSGLDNINVELADRDSRSHAQDANEQTLAYASSDDAPADVDNNIPLAPFITDGRLDLRV